MNVLPSNSVTSSLLISSTRSAIIQVLFISLFNVVDNPWNTLSNFCNTGDLHHIESFVLNDRICKCSIQNDGTRCCIQIDENGKWSDAIPIELIGVNGEEVTMKVADSVVKNCVYKDSFEQFHIFPTSSANDLLKRIFY